MHRTQDYSASCEGFVKHLIGKCKAMGVEYQRGVKVASLDVVGNRDSKHVFRVTSTNGVQQDFDVLIIAAGTQAPLLAAKLGAGAFCPTYPLRGYSLTLFTPETEGIGGKPLNLLNQPFSVDSMYCSSVTPRMARFSLVFGELVGYRDKAINVPSVGPCVLTRYAREVFFPMLPSVKMTHYNASGPSVQTTSRLSEKVSAVAGLVFCTLDMELSAGPCRWRLPNAWRRLLPTVLKRRKSQPSDICPP